MGHGSMGHMGRHYSMGHMGHFFQYLERNLVDWYFRSGSGRRRRRPAVTF